MVSPLIMRSNKDIEDAKPTLFSLKAVRIINIAIVSVERPGPPPVKAKTRSYNLKVEINITTVFIVTAGANNGQSRYLNFCIPLAPSILDASSNSFGIFFKEAISTTVYLGGICVLISTIISMSASKSSQK